MVIYLSQETVLLPKKFWVDYPSERMKYSEIWKRNLPNLDRYKTIEAKNRIIIGNSQMDYEGEDVFIPKLNMRNKNMRTSIFIIAPPGLGKTILIKNIMVQAYLLGEGLAVVCDPKMDFESAKQQNAYSKYIPENLGQVALPIKTYIGKYVTKRFSNLPDDVRRRMIFNFKLNDLEEDDMENLMGIDEDKTNYQNINSQLTFKAAWAKMVKNLGKEYSNRTFKDFEVSLKGLSDISKDDSGATHLFTKRKLLGRMQSLISQDIFGDNGINPIGDINKGYIPVFSTKYSRSTIYDTVYASVFMKKIYDAKVEGRIKKPLWLIKDEYQKLASSDSASFKTSEKILREGRSFLVNVVVSTQTFSSGQQKIPNEILSLFDHIILSRLQSKQDLNIICDSRQIEPNRSRRRILEKLHVDRENQIFEWAWINKEGEIKTFFPYHPMTGHSWEK